MAYINGKETLFSSQINMSVIDLPSQEKSAIPTLEAQEIVPDTGHTLSKVTVAAADDVYMLGQDIGRQAEYDAFWDKLQTNGTRGNYTYAFYNTYWNDITYRPKYTILLKSGNSTFAYGGMTDTIVDIDVSKATTPANITYTFQNNYNIKTIRKLIVSEKNTYSNWFTNCTALKNITFEGTIGKTISFAQSPLTLESAMNIISRLKDYFASDNAYSQTITFSDTTWALLDANPPDDIFDPTGAPLDWRGYIMDNLCWNYA